MNFKNQIELELYFADHFDTILFPVLADIYLEKNDLVRARKVCDIGLKYHENNVAGLFIVAQVEQLEGNLKKSEKLLEKVLTLSYDHLAAAEMLCEVQTVLGRAANRLLKSWKHVQSLDSTHTTAKNFIEKVEGVANDNPQGLKNQMQSDIKPKSGKTIDISKEKNDLQTIQLDDFNSPVKISPRLATFTYVSVLKNQGLFSQALEVLEILEAKGESLESISLERDTIQTLIENEKKD